VPCKPLHKFGIAVEAIMLASYVRI
jgi:hypothetical protein